MAITILPDEETFGSRLGTALGTGISGGLNALVEGKLKEIGQQKSFQQLLQSGLSQPDAQLLSSFADKPEVQAKLLGQLFQRGPMAAQQGEQQQAPGVEQAQPEGGAAQPQQEQPTSSFYQPTVREQREQQKLALKERQVVAVEQKAIRPQILKIAENARFADRNLDAINDLEKVLKTGNLRSPQTQALLEKLDLEGFFPDTKVGMVRKIITQLGFRQLQTLPSGGRPTAALWEKLEQGLPSLTLTNEGNRIISETLKIGEQEAKLLFEEVRNIRKENKGFYTSDVIEEASERIQPKMQQLIQKKSQEIDRLLGGGFEIGSMTDKLPSASSVPPGVGFEDEESGAVYKSNGKSWQRIK